MLAHSRTQREGRKRGKRGAFSKSSPPSLFLLLLREKKDEGRGGRFFGVKFLLLFFPRVGVCGGGKVFFAVYDRAGSGGIFSRRRAFQSGRRPPRYTNGMTRFIPRSKVVQNYWQMWHGILDRATFFFGRRAPQAAPAKTRSWQYVVALLSLTLPPSDVFQSPKKGERGGGEFGEEREEKGEKGRGGFLLLPLSSVTLFGPLPPPLPAKGFP